MQEYKNTKLTIQYDGRPFCGWQRQDGQISIQQLLEEAVAQICGVACNVQGSGRTDSGVHALGQVASVQIPTNMRQEQIVAALNTKLPPEIRIFKAEFVGEEFHAQYSAKQKTYRYLLHSSSIRSPFTSFDTAWAHYIPELEPMQEAARLLIGEHDFSAFMASGSSIKTTVREMRELEIWQDGNLTGFMLTATGFLRMMVRIIVGTLLEIGRGKREPEDMIRILAGKNRNLAGKTAPPEGLTLMRVDY